MAYIGKVPTAVPLGTSDLADNIITVDKLATTLDLSGNTITLPAGVGGKVLQVVQGIRTDTFTTTATGATDVGLSASITPASTSSKILIQVNLMSSSGSASITGSHLLLRDSTIIAGGDSAGSRATGFCSTGTWNGTWNGINGSGMYVDSPSTASAVTYKVQVIKEGSTYYLNRTGRDTDDAWHCRSASTIILTEIAG